MRIRHLPRKLLPLPGHVFLLTITGLVSTQGFADHDRARALRESGEIQPLEQIIRRAKEMHPGRVLEVELHDDSGRLIYEIELVGERGVVRELYFDARTGEPRARHPERE